MMVAGGVIGTAVATILAAVIIALAHLDAWWPL